MSTKSLITFFFFHLATITGFSQLTPPNSLSATDGTREHYIIVSWKSNDSDVTYHLYRTDSNNPRKAEEITLTKEIELNSKFVGDSENLVPGKLYYYWVKSEKGGIVSDFSLVDSGFIAQSKAVASTTPFSPIGALDYSNEVQFQWANIMEASQYKLQISKNKDDWSLENGFKEKIVLDTIITNNSLVWNNGKSDQQYSWTVKAIGQVEESYFSDPIGFDLSGENLFSLPFSKSDFTFSNTNFEKTGTNINVKFQGLNNTNQSLRNFKFLFFWSKDRNFDQNDFLVSKLEGNSFRAKKNKYFAHSIEIEKLNNNLEGHLIIVPMLRENFMIDNTITISLK